MQSKTTTSAWFNVSQGFRLANLKTLSIKFKFNQSVFCKTKNTDNSMWNYESELFEHDTIHPLSLLLDQKIEWLKLSFKVCG